MNGVPCQYHGMTESMFDRLHLTIDKFISSKMRVLVTGADGNLSRYLILV